jgi:hypothetical protein
MLQRTNPGGEEARLQYGDFNFAVLRQGQFVRCAVTGEKIALDDLRYWNAELQEAYKGPEEALKRWQELKGK